jgi:hypothetical protein
MRDRDAFSDRLIAGSAAGQSRLDDLSRRPRGFVERAVDHNAPGRQHSHVKLG